MDRRGESKTNGRNQSAKFLQFANARRGFCVVRQGQRNFRPSFDKFRKASHAIHVLKAAHEYSVPFFSSAIPPVAATQLVPRVSLAVVGLLLTGLLSQTALAANPVFTIAPSPVSNTYSGFITLKVTNLAPGDTVLVQKYLDLNSNGLIDATDLLVQQFQLTDGQAGMVIGGVVNSNVPGDTDGTANGQITAQLNFQNGDFMQNVVGQYLFKLSSPGNHFTPITNLFNVTNAPYAQKFTGNVVSNGTTTVLTNVVVLLTSPGGHGSPLAGAVANNSGLYTIQAPPGSYGLVAFKSNYVCNFSSPPVFTLGSGQTISNSVSVSNATSSISGRVVDSTNSGIGLPGILVLGQRDQRPHGSGLHGQQRQFRGGRLIQRRPVADPRQ